MQVFRIVQEALINARKHAMAKNIKITLAAADDHLWMEIHDDGCGFDTHRPSKDNSFGLAIMHERAEQMGGRLAVQSSPGAGTNITLEIPCSPGGLP